MDVIAAQNSIRKKSGIRKFPNGIWENAIGRESKARLGPAAGESANEKVIENIMSRYYWKVN